MDITETASAMDKLRTDLIFNPDYETGVLDHLAQCDMLQGCALVEAGIRCLERAAIHQTRALAVFHRGAKS